MVCTLRILCSLVTFPICVSFYICLSRTYIVGRYMLIERVPPAPDPVFGEDAFVDHDII